MADQPEELSRRKLKIEVEKLREEIAKIREDRRWWNRHLAVLGALCGVAATFLVGFSQFQRDSRKRNELDINRANREEGRREVESGLRLAQFVLDRRDDWLTTTDPEAQARFVRIVNELLPPKESSRLLAAVSTVATQAATVSALSTAAASLPAEQAQRVQQSLNAPPSTAPTLVPRPPAASRSDAPALPALIVFAHVPDGVDRGAAQRIIAALPPALRAAGVERVGERGPRETGEVRIYSPDQRAAAERIIAALGPLTERELGRAVPFRIVDISGNYRNLPTDRLEIWFPR